MPPDAATRSFFRRPTRTVARQLLGAWLVRRSERRLYAARIVEVEAYLGAGDAAAHSRGGRRTERVEPMWGDGGLLYVFQVYGMHFCANVVTRRAGRPEAVLLRAARHPRAPLSALSGPGRLARAFGLSREHSGLDLVGNPEWEIRPEAVSRANIIASPRIGVDYAGEAASWPLRYSIRGEPAVSRPRP
jgi:DNA-3-methyladenine glycosylase